jgi:hypothetical protein
MMHLSNPRIRKLKSSLKVVKKLKVLTFLNAFYYLLIDQKAENCCLANKNQPETFRPTFARGALRRCGRTGM